MGYSAKRRKKQMKSSSPKIIPLEMGCQGSLALNSFLRTSTILLTIYHSNNFSSCYICRCFNLDYESLWRIPLIELNPLIGMSSQLATASAGFLRLQALC